MNMLLPFLESIIAYVFLIMSLEYLLTEYFLITPYISGVWKTALFIFLLIVFVLVYYFRNQGRKASRKKILFLIFLTFVSLLVFREYRRFYDFLQQFPKIYKISSSWGIQGIEIKIEGKNFGPTWQPGKVFVDEVEFIVKEWSPNLIVAEQPVPPCFKKGNLRVISNKNTISNGVSFEIKDPIFLQAEYHQGKFRQ